MTPLNLPDDRCRSKRRIRRALPVLIVLGMVLFAAAGSGGIYRSDISMKMPRAEFDARMAELDRTVDECTHVIRANAGDVNALYRRAMAQKEKDILLIDHPGYRDTIKDLEKCVELVPDNAGIQFELGNVYMLNSQAQLALAHYDAAIQAAPSATFYRARSLAYEQLRRCYAAIHDLDEVIKAEPNCAECYYHQGQLYLMDHDTQDANERFKKAAEIDPKNGEYAHAASHPVQPYKDPAEQLKAVVIFGAAAVLGSAALSAMGPHSAPSNTNGSQSGRQTCYRCGGSGSLSVYEPSMSGRTMVLTSRTCSSCGGSGYR